MAGVGEVREDGGDTSGGGRLTGGDGDQELDNAVVDVSAARLDHENVFAADRVLDLHSSLANSKFGECDAAVRDAELVADSVCELRMGRAPEDDDVADHGGWWRSVAGERIGSCGEEEIKGGAIGEV